MKEKVYLDSSIPSYYFDERESLASFIEITNGILADFGVGPDYFF